jgi:hypothetical protein
VLVAAAVIVVAAGSAAGAALVSGSSYVATRPIGSALARAPYEGLYQDQPAGNGFVFNPGATFAFSVVVTNKAGSPITLTGARAAVTPGSPLRQVGARFTVFKLIKPLPYPNPGPSEAPRTGPPYGYNPIGPPPYEGGRPAPLELAPGHQALAQLNFHFVQCWNKPLPWRPVVRAVTVAYRTPAGTVIHERIRPSDPSVLVLPNDRSYPSCSRQP